MKEIHIVFLIMIILILILILLYYVKTKQHFTMYYNRKNTDKLLRKYSTDIKVRLILLFTLSIIF